MTPERKKKLRVSIIGRTWFTWFSLTLTDPIYSCCCVKKPLRNWRRNKNVRQLNVDVLLRRDVADQRTLTTQVKVKQSFFLFFIWFQPLQQNVKPPLIKKNHFKIFLPYNFTIILLLKKKNLQMKCSIEVQNYLDLIFYSYTNHEKWWQLLKLSYSNTKIN